MIQWKNFKKAAILDGCFKKDGYLVKTADQRSAVNIFNDSHRESRLFWLKLKAAVFSYIFEIL